MIVIKCPNCSKHNWKLRKNGNRSCKNCGEYFLKIKRKRRKK